MVKVVHTLGYDFWGGGGRSIGSGFVDFVDFGCFVDIKEGLAGGGVGFVWALAVGAFESGVGAGLSVVWQVGQTWWRVLCSPAQSWHLIVFLQTVEWCPKPWQAFHWLLGCVSLYAAHLVCTAPISRPFLMTPSSSCFVLK